MTRHLDETGTVTGLIPDHPPPAYIYLPQPSLNATFTVEDRTADLGLVALHLAPGVGIHLHTPAQAREFVRAFALALDMLTPRPPRCNDCGEPHMSHRLDCPQLPQRDLAAVPDAAQDAGDPDYRCLDDDESGNCRHCGAGKREPHRPQCLVHALPADAAQDAEATS